MTRLHQWKSKSSKVIFRVVRELTNQIYKTDALIAQDIDAYLESHQNKSLLRFITCGSVDDGKSTLIGRLLYDSQMIFEDQLAQLEADSKKVGTQGQEIDFALLVDGLAAEREQGITIDVAYRFLPRKNVNLLWRIHRVTNNIRATWSRARQLRNWP
jgi:hypothetical protein